MTTHRPDQATPMQHEPTSAEPGQTLMRPGPPAAGGVARAGAFAAQVARRSEQGVRRLVHRLRHGRVRLGRLASEVGQGTVEYVGLLLLMATILAGVVAAASSLGGKDEIGKKVVTQIGSSIDKAGGSGR